MRQIEQMKKEKDVINEKFEKLKQEIETLRIKMREEYTRYVERINEQDRLLKEKDDEIARKDEIIKNLT